MRISKAIFSLVAIATIILIAGLPGAMALEGLITWPTERSAQGSTKATSTFTLGEKIIGINERKCSPPYYLETKVFMFMRVRTGNSFTYDIVTAEAPGTYCLVGGFEDLTKQYAILDFLNSDAVLDLICPDCSSEAVVHLKRVFDDVWNYESFIVPGPPLMDPVYSAVGDFELVVNETPINWEGYEPSSP